MSYDDMVMPDGFVSYRFRAPVRFHEEGKLKTEQNFLTNVNSNLALNNGIIKICNSANGNDLFFPGLG